MNIFWVIQQVDMVLNTVGELSCDSEVVDIAHEPPHSL